MLRIVVPDQEYLDETDSTFVNIKGTTLELEHSLISVSKWESKWEKPFLSKEDRTPEETLSYIEDMVVSPRNLDPKVLDGLTDEDLRKINDYIGAKMTATTIRETPGTRSSQIVTAEIIYYWMISYTIPFSCEKWHLNRLITLIRVCSENNKPKKKMSRSELIANQRRLNAERRQQYGTKG